MSFAALARLLTLRRAPLRAVPGHPAALGALWIGGTGLLVLAAYLAPYPVLDIVRPFAALSAMVLGALGVAALLKMRGDAERLAFAFVAIGLVGALLSSVVEREAGYLSSAWYAGHLAVFAWATAATGRLIYASAPGLSAIRRAAALGAAMLALLACLHGAALHDRLQIAHYESAETEPYRDIDAEALWTAQGPLVARAAERIASARSPGGDVHVVSIAAGGGQDIFGREARAVGALLQSRFGGQGGPTVLSNAWDDLGRVPMANRTNIAAVLRAVGEGFDPARDLAIVYLTAHGGTDASLGTDLPDHSRLRPVDAAFLAKALEQAGVTRRLIVVSACYSGSWIAPLQSPDTVVLTAARADRTSFGCDDRREYTWFGEALLEGPLGEGASLAEASAALKERIDAAERESDLQPSLPQTFVGANMRAFWQTQRED